MNYVIIVMVLVLAAAFGGYLGSLRAVQLLAEHERKKHRNQGPPRPEHIYCRHSIPDPRTAGVATNSKKSVAEAYEKQVKDFYKEGNND